MEHSATEAGLSAFADRRLGCGSNRSSRNPDGAQRNPGPSFRHSLTVMWAAPQP